MNRATQVTMFTHEQGHTSDPEKYSGWLLELCENNYNYSSGLLTEMISLLSWPSVADHGKHIRLTLFYATVYELLTDCTYPRCLY